MPISNRRLPWIGFPAILVLAALAKRLPPDGLIRDPLGRFVGRFHPVLVHLPIALLLLVPALEIAGRVESRSHLRRAAGFVLALGAFTSLIAAFDGWLLAWTGGYSGPLVLRHMWAGVWLCAASFTLVCLRPARPIYLTGLVGLIAVLTWTSDQGGSLTHGAHYLTENLPQPLRRWFGSEPRPVPSGPAEASSKATYYSAKVEPIFNQHCVSCHGPNKIKGGLRLDGYARLMRGGEDGPAIDPWHPRESELIRRVTLPRDDDDFMPSGGKKPLTPAEIRIIADWIGAGASDKAPANAEIP